MADGIAQTKSADSGWVGRFLPFTEWWGMLDRPSVKVDIVAGITAGVLILPQAVALAAIAGLPPEFGLYTSIFPVIIAALFGSSWHVMSGPNTALAVLIFIDLSSFASRSTEEYIMYAMGLTFMAGAFQLLFGLARLGVVFNFISHSVIVGLVAGVGIVIIIQQLGNFFGLVMNQREEIYETLMQVFYNLNHANWYAATAGFATVASGLLIRKYRRKWPHLVLAVIIGTAVGWFVDGLFGSANTRIDKLGTLTLAALPFKPVDWSADNIVVFRELIASAVLIAILGLMQSAVIARAMAVRSGQQVNMNQEIIGQGLGNIVGSYLSCFASCGSFNRSAANIDAGARTPLASLVSAAALAVLIWIAAPLIALMPISVMAGILFLVGWGLVDLREIRKLVNVREEFVIFIACFIVSVVFGLDYGVFVGVLLSVVAYFRDVSRPEIHTLVGDDAAHLLPPGAPRDSHVLRLTGNLFFGSVHAVELQLREIAARDERRGHLFLSLDLVGYLDTAGALLIAKEAASRRQAGGSLDIGFRDHSLDEMLQKSGLVESVGPDHIYYRAGTPGVSTYSSIFREQQA
jgi:SulP family sulfate permease